MPRTPHVIETRQKMDPLFEAQASKTSNAKDLLAAAATFQSAVKLVSGYGSINFLIIADQAFTLRVQEASYPEGPWAQTLSQASALDAATGNQFICLQVAPCGKFMQVFVDNGATAQLQFTLDGSGLPVAGGGGSSSGGGGGGTGSCPANRATFQDNHQTVAVPGTAVQLQNQAIPNCFDVWVAALDDNTGNIYFGNSAADAQNHTKANILSAGAFRRLAVTNVNAIWIDADVAGEGVQWLVEV